MSPSLGRSRSGFPLGKAWHVGLAVLPQRGRCGGTGCCCQGISALVMEEVGFRTPSLASSLLSEPLEHHSRKKHYLESSHCGNAKEGQGYEQLVLKFSIVQPEAAAVTGSRACSRAQVPSAETGGMQPLLLGAVVAGNERSKWPDPGTLQTRCKIALYQSWPAAMTHGQKRGSKETTVEEGEQGHCLEIIDLLRPPLKSLYYCKDELATNSWTDRQSLRCKRMGLRQFSIIWVISVLIEAFTAGMWVELLKSCPHRNRVCSDGKAK